MSGLKERLQRLKQSETGSRNGEREGVKCAAEAGGNVDGDTRFTVESGWEKLGGVRVESNAFGSFLLRERVYEADYRHGICVLGELSGLAGELGSLVAGGTAAVRPVPKAQKRRLEGGKVVPGASLEPGQTAAHSAAGHQEGAVELERLLFFDTETTALGIGAGNVPFMIGLGFYLDGQFVVQQLFIRNPAEEAAMLAYFDALLGRFEHIVSYNGRSFDWPIVQSRFVLARRKTALETWRHIDLLYPARGLWKTILPSCRLGVVEADKLGFRRNDDVPGSMAPELYVQYLAERDPRVIGGVFIHNEHDIVSLAALAVHLAKLLRGGEPPEGFGDEELLRLCVWLDKQKRPELAELMRARLGLRLLDGGIRLGRERLLLELAAAYKKRSQHDRAAELWRRYVAERGGGFSCPVEPFIELAMYCEHRERCYGEALTYAEEALNRIWKRMSLNRVDDRQREMIETLQRRIRRLRAKQQRAAAIESGGKRQRSGGNRTSYPVDSSEGTAAKIDEELIASVQRMAITQPRKAIWPKAARAKRVKPEYVRESLI